MEAEGLVLERNLALPDFGLNDFLQKASQTMAGKLENLGVGTKLQRLLAARSSKRDQGLLLVEPKRVDPQMLAMSLEVGQGANREDAQAVATLYAVATGNKVEPGVLSQAVDHQIEAIVRALPAGEEDAKQKLLSLVASFGRGINRTGSTGGGDASPPGGRRPRRGEGHETERRRSDTEERNKALRGCGIILLATLVCCGGPPICVGIFSAGEKIGSVLPVFGDEDYRAVLALPSIGDELKNLYAGSQINMIDLLTKPNQPNVFDGLVTQERFNPDDGFSPQELARARGWTHALRQRYFVSDQFQQKQFIDDMVGKGYSQDSIKRFLDKYDKFLRSIGVNIVSQIPPKDLPAYAKGTTFYRDLRRSVPVGSVGKNRAKEMRSMRG